MARAHVLRAIWLGLLLTVAGSAAAEQVLYSSTIRAAGSAAAPEFLTSIEMPITAAGDYRSTTKDWRGFDVPLQALSFGVYTSKGKIAGREGAGILDFFNPGQGKIFLQIYALTSGSHYAGLIGVQCDPLQVV